MIRKSDFTPFLALVLLLVGVPATAQVGGDDADMGAIDRAARADLQASSATTGLVAGVLYDGDIDFLGAWGTPAPGSDEELNSQYLFAWPALTEMMVAATVRALHDAEQLDAFQPLGQRVPGLPTWLQTTTLDQLLTHRAGLSDADANPSWVGMLTELPTSLRMAPPGSVFSWSRWSYPIAGRILETLVGAPVAEIAQFAIIGPLGMSRTSFDLRFAEAGGRAQGVPDAQQEAWDLPVVYTTASDVLQFAAAWMGEAIRGTTPGRWMPQTEVMGRSFADGLWMERYASMGRFYREGTDLGFTTDLELFRFLEGSGIDARGEGARVRPPNTALVFWGNGLGANALRGSIEQQIYFDLGLLGLDPNPGAQPSALDASWVGAYANGDRTFTLVEGPQGIALVEAGRTFPLLREPSGSYVAVGAGASSDDEPLALVPRVLGTERILYVDYKAFLAR